MPLNPDAARLIEDTSQLPRIDLVRLDIRDTLVVQTDTDLYELVLAVLNIENNPPIWMAHTRGSRWLRHRVCALIGANTNFHQVVHGAEISLETLELNRLIQGFPVVLGDLHDGCAVMGPVEHVWVNSCKEF